MAVKFQNDPHTTGQPPSYYANHRLYPGSYARTDWQTRTSRRIHDGFSLQANYGLDTTSDDVNSSPYSSPYYINGRYNSDNLVTQRGNSASVQGTERLLVLREEENDFTKDDIQTTLEMWQGKQIKFVVPYTNKVIGNTITLRNTGGCTGVLSIYFSAKEDGEPIAETAIDLCTVSEDIFEHRKVYSNLAMPTTANPRGKLYVRMEIWGEISQKRSANPFNTGRKIEIAATAAGNHYACEYKLGDKNAEGEEVYDYKFHPSRPLLGLIYNDWECIPVDRPGAEKNGASISKGGYRYDVFCLTNGVESELVIYDKEMNSVATTDIPIDARSTQVNIAQVVDTSHKNWLYFVDGYSPLRRAEIGVWTPEEVTSANPPVFAPSLLMFHNNRLYIGGFLNDPNLFQATDIKETGPDYTSFPYRFYAPNNSPDVMTTNPPVAIVEHSSDTIMISGKNFHSIFQTNVNYEDGTPTQVSTFADSVGVLSQGDIVNYKGTLYSFDRKEGIRRYNGAQWSKLPTSVDSHYDRVDMTKPRKLWGYDNKLYFNYTDSIDGKYKCLIWDSQMNYQQYPWFQDVDVPFCDVRFDESEDIIGIHPDYPCIMKLYAEDTWRRLDSPITFERHTKYLSIPGNAADMIVKRVHNKVIANSDKWWWFALSADEVDLTQERGRDHWYRMPCWATKHTDEPVEYPFPFEDIYEENAIQRLTISQIRIRCSSIQEKIKCKTFRSQANLVSTLFEVYPRQYS